MRFCCEEGFSIDGASWEMGKAGEWAQGDGKSLRQEDWMTGVSFGSLGSWMEDMMRRLWTTVSGKMWGDSCSTCATVNRFDHGFSRCYHPLIS